MDFQRPIHTRQHLSTLISWRNNTKNISWCQIIYEITVLLLRTSRFPEIRTYETIDELRLVTVSVHQCSTLIHIYMLLLPEGQTGESWEPSNKTALRDVSGKVGHKLFSHPLFRL